MIKDLNKNANIDELFITNDIVKTNNNTFLLDACYLGYPKSSYLDYLQSKNTTQTPNYYGILTDNQYASNEIKPLKDAIKNNSAIAKHYLKQLDKHKISFFELITFITAISERILIQSRLEDNEVYLNI